VGKYNSLPDAYKSLIEAFIHAGIHHTCRVKTLWINSDKITEENVAELLQSASGVMVPGGFGVRGTEGKIIAIRHARENKIPFFGICLGMQLATIEIARNILNIKDATSTEFTKEGTGVIALINEWTKDGKSYTYSENDDLGGTMRLGSFPCNLSDGSLAKKIYNSSVIHERHRHRLEFNINFKDAFTKSGVVFSGMSPDGDLTEIIELPNHPWFVGVQFHPELKSRPFEPHPLFISFIKAAMEFGCEKL
jgi:CTP synthase